MKFLKILFLFSCLIATSQVAFSHPGGHGYDEPTRELKTAEEAFFAARVHIYNLVTDKEIPESWMSAEPKLDLSKMDTIEGRRRWVLIYHNSAEKNSARKTLQFLLTPSGKLVSYEFLSLRK